MVVFVGGPGAAYEGAGLFTPADAGYSAAALTEERSEPDDQDGLPSSTHDEAIALADGVKIGSDPPARGRVGRSVSGGNPRRTVIAHLCSTNFSGSRTRRALVLGIGPDRWPARHRDRPGRRLGHKDPGKQDGGVTRAGAIMWIS
jgi:hypothetical protein